MARLPVRIAAIARHYASSDDTEGTGVLALSRLVLVLTSSRSGREGQAGRADLASVLHRTGTHLREVGGLLLSRRMRLVLLHLVRRRVSIVRQSAPELALVAHSGLAILVLPRKLLLELLLLRVDHLHVLVVLVVLLALGPVVLLVRHRVRIRDGVGRAQSRRLVHQVELLLHLLDVS